MSEKLEGVYVLRVPMQYLSETATTEQKLYLESLLKDLKQIQFGEKNVMVLPPLKDNFGDYLFKLERVDI